MNTNDRLVAEAATCAAEHFEASAALGRLIWTADGRRCFQRRDRLTIIAGKGQSLAVVVPGIDWSEL